MSATHEPIDFRSLFQEPKWRPCVDCGTYCNAERCHYCQQSPVGDLAREAKLTLLSVPEAFRWCQQKHPRMAELITLSFAEDGDGAPQYTPDRAIARILAAPQAVVTLTGLSRAGKTCMASALFRASLGAAYKARAEETRKDRSTFAEPLGMWEWTSALAIGEASLEHGLGEKAPVLRRAMRAKFLVIDELLDPKHATKALNIYGMLDHRHGLKSCRTVVTTGLTPGQIETVYSAGGLERLFEPQSALVVHVRKRGAA